MTILSDALKGMIPRESAGSRREWTEEIWRFPVLRQSLFLAPREDAAAEPLQSEAQIAILQDQLSTALRTQEALAKQLEQACRPWWRRWLSD